MENITKLNWSWHTIRVPPDSLKYFSQKFSENRDIVFCHLNEIEPKFLNEENNESDNEDNETIVSDPRNKQPIEMFIFDYTKENCKKIKQIEKIPNYPTKSSLSKKQHDEGLRVLIAKQNRIQPFLEDCTNFDGTLKLRTAEYELFTKFLNSYYSANFREIYEIGKELCQLYENYLNEKRKIVLQQPNRFYRLQTALPLDYDVMEVSLNIEPKIILSNGIIAVYDDDDDDDNKNGNNKFWNLKSIQRNLYETLLQNVMSIQDEKMQTEISTESNVICPEETLFLLLIAFSKDCTNWEIPVSIQENRNISNNIFDGKFIKFEKALPERLFNLQTADRIYEHLLETHVKLSKNFDWLDLSSRKLIHKNEKNNCDELFAVDLNQSYSIIPFNEYIKKIKSKGNRNDKELSSKTNTILIEWSLDTSNGKPLKIHTERNILFYRKNYKNIEYLNTSIKLEYKTQFGAEIMTKRELIREWMRQYLTPDSSTRRVRINAKNFETILEQQLNISDIEDELFRLYKLKPINVLSSLYGFLTTFLNNFPPGEYLLKNDLKHKDKIMVFSETEKSLDNNILNIHRLYEDASCINCTNEIEFISIDSTVVTPIHLQYSILPGCFPHWGMKKQIGFNDKVNILQKVQKEKLKRKMNLKNMKDLAKKRRKQVKNQKKKKKIKQEKKISEMIEGELEGYSTADMLQYSINNDNEIEMIEERKECEVESGSTLLEAVQKAPSPAEFSFEQYLADANLSCSDAGTTTTTTSTTSCEESDIEVKMGRQLRPRKKKSKTSVK